MKSTLIIAAILASAVTLGIWQNSRLHELKRETASLETRATRPVSAPRDRPAESAPAPESPSQQEKDALREEIVTAFLAFKDRDQGAAPDQAERRRTMLRTSAKFSPDDIGQLLKKLREDPRLVGQLDENETILLCLQIFSETAPAAAIKFLEGHRDLPDWDAHYAGCFSNFLRTNPREAIRRFDDEAARGNPDFANSAARQGILIRESKIDPDKMLARAMTPEFASDPETIAHIGGYVASILKTPAEHQQFLAALRRKQNAGDPAPQILKIRAEYIEGLSQKLHDFRFEDSSVLIDSEFTHDEKLASIAVLSSRGDLSDPAKWADWLLKNDSTSWENWATARGKHNRYPVIDVLSNWARQDYQASGKWLEGAPAGPFKAAMSLEYAWTIADVDPALATRYLPQIPVGKDRKNLVKKIAEALDTSDPVAAAAFRAENPPAKK